MTNEAPKLYYRFIRVSSKRQALALGAPIVIITLAAVPYNSMCVVGGSKWKLPKLKSRHRGVRRTFPIKSRP